MDFIWKYWLLYLFNLLDAKAVNFSLTVSSELKWYYFTRHTEVMFIIVRVGQNLYRHESSDTSLFLNLYLNTR